MRHNGAGTGKKNGGRQATAAGGAEIVLRNECVAVWLDRRFPRAICYDDAISGTRVLGQVEAALPRVCVYNRAERRELTSDDLGVETAYRCQTSPTEARYAGDVSVHGVKAADFELLFTLEGRDLVVRLGNVREHAGFFFLTARLERLASAVSDDGDSRVVTGVFQGRVLDPAKCKPHLLDFSWCYFTARPCGAAYRPSFMVTVDTNINGYEDLLVNDVNEYSRASTGRTIASLGVEMMHRQRNINGTPADLKIQPPEAKAAKVIPGVDPFLCAAAKETRLHFISASKCRALDWTDAATYFQSLLPAGTHCHPLYDGALVYKINMSHREKPYLTFEEALDIIRQVHHATGGMRQVCYLTYFQSRGGETDYPEVWKIFPPLGDKNMLRRVMKEAAQYNAIVSFHQNLDVFDAEADCVDGNYIARDCNGRLYDGGYWHPNQLLRISLPNYRRQARKHIDRLVREYGISQTYHLDQYNGEPYSFDANPTRPWPSKEFVQGKLELLDDFKARGIDVTSESLTHPYVGHIGHCWSLFNSDAYWEGEQTVPFTQFIYHHATSWNSSKADTVESMLDSLIQGGGCGLAWPMGNFIVAEGRIDIIPTPWDQVLDALYLLQQPYLMLRGRKWTGMTTTGTTRRVEYGPLSHIEVDDASKTYQVMVDGRIVAKDFVTVVPAPDGQGVIAYARYDTELDWPTPKGWRDGTYEAVALALSGKGIRSNAVVADGRLRLKLKSHQPLRCSGLKRRAI